MDNRINRLKENKEPDDKGRTAEERADIYTRFLRSTPSPDQRGPSSGQGGSSDAGPSHFHQALSDLPSFVDPSHSIHANPLGPNREQSSFATQHPSFETDPLRNPDSSRVLPSSSSGPVRPRKRPPESSEAGRSSKTRRTASGYEGSLVGSDRSYLLSQSSS